MIDTLAIAAILTAWLGLFLVFIAGADWLDRR
jgi:hypothetical protein